MSYQRLCLLTFLSMSTPPPNLPFAPEVSDEELEAELVRLSSDAPASPPPTPPTRPASPEIRTMPPVVAPLAPLASPAADDMFSGLDQSPKKPTAPMGLGDLPQRRSSSAPKHILLFAGVLLLAGGIGFAFWEFAIKRPAEQRAQANPVAAPVQQVTPPAPVLDTPLASPPASIPVLADPTLPVGGSSDLNPSVPAPLPTPVVTPPAGANIPPPEVVSPLPSNTPSGATVDSDQDGLSDQRELELGTDPQNKDTDVDGLTDGDEVLRYGTNPLDRDTDKDSFLDGKEVENGYNPRGSNRCAKPDCSV